MVQSINRTRYLTKLVRNRKCWKHDRKKSRRWNFLRSENRCDFVSRRSLTCSTETKIPQRKSLRSKNNWSRRKQAYFLPRDLNTRRISCHNRFPNVELILCRVSVYNDRIQVIKFTDNLSCVVCDELLSHKIPEGSLTLRFDDPECDKNQ